MALNLQSGKLADKNLNGYYDLKQSARFLHGDNWIVFIFKVIPSGSESYEL